MGHTGHRQIQLAYRLSQRCACTVIRGDGTFEDVTQRAGLASPSGMGMAADYDNDGDTDLASPGTSAAFSSSITAMAPSPEASRRVGCARGKGSGLLSSTTTATVCSTLLSATMSEWSPELERSGLYVWHAGQGLLSVRYFKGQG